eukprot:TRINITY_DN3730_c0_g1_i1.p1 TRINITY_DN3730_c0_g1~~TRINITY_DN3730_c0_g1_i1.p1  ORF type:complete len:553 (-),score=115.78 TRINITY_DN3730_c0_g1_i1:307-1965(-)
MAFNSAVALFILTLAAVVYGSEFDDAVHFRNVLATYTQQYDANMYPYLNQLIYLPPPDLLDLSHEVTSLSEMDKRVHGINVSDVIAFANTFPIKPLTLEKANEAFLPDKGHPITLFLIVGFGGELIDTWPFMDLWEKNPNSFFAKKFAANWKTAKHNDQYDLMWDMAQEAFVEKSMQDLVRAWSVDWSDGSPMVQFVACLTPFMSLESFSFTLEESVDLYYRRISKMRAILDPQIQDTYFFGYSRSGAVALAMASDIRRKDIQLKGVISIAGVYYGSVMADALMGDIQPLPSYAQATSQSLEALRYLNTKLVAESSHFIQNSFYITECLAKIAGYFLSEPKIPEMGQLKMKYPSLTITWRTMIELAIKDLNLTHPIKDYEHIVRKSKLYISHVLTDAPLLTTKQRLAWLRTHTIAEDLSYYSLLNTEEDPEQLAWDDPLAEKGLLHPDTWFLRQQYYMLLQASGGVHLNDGQVTLSHALLLPKVHQALNPLQKDFNARTHWMALIGGSHWSTALPWVVATDDKWRAFFPRDALLMTVANYISQDRHHVTTKK